MLSELNKRLRTEQKEYETLLQQEEELKEKYEEYLKIKEGIEQKERLIESLQLVIKHTPEESQIKKDRKSKGNNNSIQYNEVLDYITTMLQNCPQGAKNKDIVKAIDVGMSLQVTGQKLFREMAKDQRFVKIDKQAWKLAE